jgi:hypothetical protein
MPGESPRGSIHVPWSALLHDLRRFGLGASVGLEIPPGRLSALFPL